MGVIPFRQLVFRVSCQSPPMPDNSARLLEYLAALTKLGSKTVFSLDEYERVFWLHSLPRESPLCFCRAWKAEEQGDDRWLTIKKAPFQSIQAAIKIIKEEKMNRLIINTLLLLAILSRSATPATAKNIWQGCGSVTEIPSSECDALVSLYNSTNGQKWKDNKGWLETTTPCSWHGVSCRSGNVTRLDLSANHLDGVIPSALGNFSDMHRQNAGR